jgi:alpha-L-rhamnosidase
MDDAFHIFNLRCEYMINPLGIDVRVPRLSWKIQSNRRGAMQSAYRIFALDTGTGATLWDSGKVISEQSSLVEYAGKPLKSQQQVEWKVMIWDEFDHPTQWSETAWWEMGLLNDSDWNAAWIGATWVGGPRTTSPCPYLRKEFDLPGIVTTCPDLERSDGATQAEAAGLDRLAKGAVKKARLYITALGLYEAYLNGHPVGDDVLSPGWTDYRKRVRYRVYDVTDLLFLGTNALGVILGDGWYCGNVAWLGRQFYGDRPKLLAQLQVEFTDGTRACVVTDQSWKTSYGPILESDLLMGESYDARLEFPGWDQPGFNDHPWQNAVVFPDPGVQLVGVNSPLVKRIQELHPVADPGEIPAWPRSKWIFDFGQNMVGRVRMKVSGPRGATITLRHGEMLNPDGTLYTENLRAARQTDYYTLKGEGEEIFEPHFTFHGFRYVEVSGLPGKPERDLLTGVVLHSATPLTGSFECSDPLVNQLHQNILWGQKGNFVGCTSFYPNGNFQYGCGWFLHQVATRPG